MVQLTDVKDPDAALTAATRFAARTADIETVGRAGLSLIAQMAALAPLFGDDEAGRRYRKNYSGAADQLGEIIELFGGGVRTVGEESRKLLHQLVDGDDPRYLAA